MKNKTKKQLGQIMAIIGIVGGLVGYSSTVGKDSLIGRHTNEFVGKIEGVMEGPLSFLKGMRSKIKMPGVGKPDYQPIVDACMDAMFVERSGFHFSQSQWGGAPVPYQFRGLELIGPETLPPNAGDIQRGIDKRIGFQFHVAAYRRYNLEKNQWDPWQFDTPPNLTDMSFARENGNWKIAVAPHKSYAVR